MLYSVGWSKCCFFSDVSWIWYSVLAISAKVTIPIPPSFTDSDNSFLPMLLGICQSIRAGMKPSQNIWFDQASVNIGRY